MQLHVPADGRAAASMWMNGIFAPRPTALLARRHAPPTVAPEVDHGFVRSEATAPPLYDCHSITVARSTTYTVVTAKSRNSITNSISNTMVRAATSRIAQYLKSSGAVTKAAQ